MTHWASGGKFKRTCYCFFFQVLYFLRDFSFVYLRRFSWRRSKYFFLETFSSKCYPRFFFGDDFSSRFLSSRRFFLETFLPGIPQAAYTRRVLIQGFVNDFVPCRNWPWYQRFPKDWRINHLNQQAIAITTFLGIYSMH